MTELTHETINSWADDKNGPVALHLKQRLIPVEGEGAVIFPPTYADIGYNIDTLSDGTKVATIDSVGAQANRIEPIFKDSSYAALVPQIEILCGNEKVTTILDASHRLGDALIRCIKSDSDEANAFNLSKVAHDAFEALKDRNDASEIAKIAPTSLVFGAWDSRDTHAKLPRIVQSVIRAWNVEKLSRSAQYNPSIDYAELEVFTEAEKEKQEGDPKSQLAKRGFVHVPATGTHGGVIAKGGIERQVTINLVALRRLEGKDTEATEKLRNLESENSESAKALRQLEEANTEATKKLRRYVLGLSLVAATAPLDPFLRQGCLLVPDPDETVEWSLVERNGSRIAVNNLNEQTALNYAKSVARAFGVGKNRCLSFSKELAKKDANKDKKAKTKTKAA